MHSTADSTEPKPVTITTSGFCGRDWSSRNSSVPSPSGRRTSTKIRSKVSLASISCAPAMRAGGGDVIAPLAQLLFQVFADDRVVLENDDFFNRHGGAESGSALAAVKFGDKMGPLAVRRDGNSRGGTSPRRSRHCSFSRSSKNDFHGQVLVLPQQPADFRMPGAFVRGRVSAS